MRLSPVPFPSLPPDTARAAKSVFGIDHMYLLLGDKLDALFADVCWDRLLPDCGTEACTLFVIAMLTAFQFVENTPDSPAAEELGTRMDWKYALHLGMDYPGIDPSQLEEFRHMLMQHPEGQPVFESMLSRLSQAGLLSRDEHNLNAMHVLTSVERLSKVETVATRMRMALEALATADPDWLRRVGRPYWFIRYCSQQEACAHVPEEQEAWLRAAEDDITYLFRALSGPQGDELRAMPEVQALANVWQREFGFHEVY